MNDYINKSIENYQNGTNNLNDLINNLFKIQSINSIEDKIELHEKEAHELIKVKQAIYKQLRDGLHL